MGPEPSLYALLRLPTTATAQDLRQAFRSLSKLYHPDTTDLPAAEAEQRFRSLQQAYLTLSDPGSRQAYDQQLRLSQLRRAAALATITTAAAPLRRVERPVPVRRALSGGEWFALVLLAGALLFSMVLGVGLAWWRGVELVAPPSSPVLAPPSPPVVATLDTTADQPGRQTAEPPGADAGDDPAAPSPDAPVQPSPAGP